MPAKESSALTRSAPYIPQTIPNEQAVSGGLLTDNSIYESINDVI